MTSTAVTQRGNVALVAPDSEHGVGRLRLSGVVGDRVRQVTLLAIGALAILNGADVITTHILLAHRAVEANPLSSFLLASQSLLWVKLAVLAVLGLRVINSKPRLGVMAATCFAAGIYATAVLSNLLVLNIVAR